MFDKIVCFVGMTLVVLFMIVAISVFVSFVAFLITDTFAHIKGFLKLRKFPPSLTDPFEGTGASKSFRKFGEKS